MTEEDQESIDQPGLDDEAVEPDAEPLPPKRFRAASDDELDPQSFIVSDDRAAARAVLRGGSVGTSSGDAHFIGEAIRSLAGALRQAAERYAKDALPIGNPLLRGVAFGNSVTLYFLITDNEEVVSGVDNRYHSPTIDAAETLGDLLSAEPPELVKRAARLAPNAVSAYKGFLNVLAKDSVTLEWRAREVARVVVITSDQARRDAAVLSEAGKRVTERLHVPGALTMADSELRQFKLTLSPDVGRPPLLKNKQRIFGTYRPELGQKLKEAHLWDSPVLATIDVELDLPGESAIPRPPTFQLVDAQPLISPPRLFDTTEL